MYWPFFFLFSTKRSWEVVFYGGSCLWQVCAKFVLKGPLLSNTLLFSLFTRFKRSFRLNGKISPRFQFDSVCSPWQNMFENVQSFLELTFQRNGWRPESCIIKFLDDWKLNLKVNNYWQVPDSPPTHQGALEPVSGLTGMCGICMYHFLPIISSILDWWSSFSSNILSE